MGDGVARSICSGRRSSMPIPPDAHEATCPLCLAPVPKAELVAHLADVHGRRYEQG